MRNVSKSVVKNCLDCKRFDATACNQPVSPLPDLRVTAQPPFAVTGIDFAGPLYCRDNPKKKYYILLFTCAVTRALHLELTESMSLTDFMLTLRKFTSRRGIPSVIYSDNAKTFQAASNEVLNHYQTMAPEWKFIVPRSSWWGGFYEIMVKLTKRSLKRSLGKKCVSKVELETILSEVEACVNSRPLLYVPTHSDDYQVLSPCHFLLGRNTAGIKSVDTNELNRVTTLDLINKNISMSRMFSHFWKIWHKQYITSLPVHIKRFKKKCSLHKNSIVIVKEDNIPRLQWPLGRVLEVYKGRDGLIRSAKIKTAKGIIVRAIQRLYDLELTDCSDCDEANTNDDNVVDCNDVTNDISEVPIHDVMKTRSGRIVRTPLRFTQ